MQTWKKIVIDGEETVYSVSDDAHVRNDKTGRELKGTYTTNEYHSIQLTIKGKPKTFMVHRLVAMAFCENPDPKTYTLVDHIDRNYHNDHSSNLRWVTPSINARNAERPRQNKSSYYKEDFSDDWVQILDFPDYMTRKDGTVVKISNRKIVVQQDRHGYKRVLLNGQMKSVNRIVWESFNNQRIAKGYYIDHIDGNKSNNNLSNLRLVTQSENMLNAYRNGHKNQVKVYQFDTEGNLIKEFPSYQKAATEIEVSHPAIRAAVNNCTRSGGYYWTREEDKDNIIQVIKTKHKKLLP